MYSRSSAQLLSWEFFLPLSPLLTAIFLSFWVYSLVLVKKKISIFLRKGRRNVFVRIDESVFIFLSYTWLRIWLDKSYFRLQRNIYSELHSTILLSLSFQLLLRNPKSILILCLLYVTLFWFFLEALRIFSFSFLISFAVMCLRVSCIFSSILLYTPWALSTWKLMTLNCGMLSCYFSEDRLFLFSASIEMIIWFSPLLCQCDELHELIFKC